MTSTCANAKPILVLNFAWNLAFVPFNAGLLLSPLNECPSTPLRLWLCWYAFERILHMGFVYFKYWRRTNNNYGAELGLSLSKSRSRLTVIFLAFGVFIIILCIKMACAMIFAVLSFILAYAIRFREGASEEDIKLLPKYRFSHSNSLVMVDDNMEEPVKARTDACNGNNANEFSLHQHDSECCICLSLYVECAELYRLPCKHHFHCRCSADGFRPKHHAPSPNLMSSKVIYWFEVDHFSS